MHHSAFILGLVICVSVHSLNSESSKWRTNIISGQSKFQDFEELFKGLGQKLAKTDASTHNSFPLIPILFPKLNDSDPRFIRDDSFTFKSNILRGTHAYTNNVLRGYKTIRDALTLEINPPSYDISYQMNMNISIDGNYDTDLDILNGYTFYKGKGLFSIFVENFRFGVDMKITATAKPSIEMSGLTIDFGFSNLEIEAENSFFNCKEANWKEIANEIKLLVNTYWGFLDMTLSSKILQPLFNDLFKNCDINEILNNQNYTCIGSKMLGSMEKTLMDTLIPKIKEKLPHAGTQWENPCSVTPRPTATTDKVTATTTERENAATQSAASGIFGLLFSIWFTLSATHMVT